MIELPVSVTPAADRDLTEIRDWYQRQRPGLEDQFTDAVDEAVAAIRRAPEAPVVLRGGVRRVTVLGFPHGVFYRVEPSQVTVLAVVHPKRDPRAWQSRA